MPQTGKQKLSLRLQAVADFVTKAKLLQQLPGYPDQLVDRLYHVHRNPDRTRLIRNGPCNRLADPPGRVSAHEKIAILKGRRENARTEEERADLDREIQKLSLEQDQGEEAKKRLLPVLPVSLIFPKTCAGQRPRFPSQMLPALCLFPYACPIFGMFFCLLPYFCFESMEEQREIAAVFHETIREVQTKEARARRTSTLWTSR